ncbi:MAG: MBL fold metallo-hydrolase [Clostridiales bacterium]|nr:MBL fold metallo-hydrolase [Clostridiales bacterium]
MKVTYIHHSSFLVELRHALLLFDYTEGPLPELAPDKDLIIFASHIHGDHFAPVIFSLAVKHPRARYVLSDDIPAKQVPQALTAPVNFIGSGHTCSLALTCGSDLTIHAYKSTDEGVAFVVSVDGAIIYHAGDLNDWRWNGEPDDWNNQMHVDYLRELNAMRADGIHPDVAMVPLDGRLENWFYLGLDEFMEIVGARAVFPMHFWKDYDIIRRLKELPCSAPYRDRVADIRACGQEFPVKISGDK